MQDSGKSPGLADNDSAHVPTVPHLGRRWRAGSQVQEVLLWLVLIVFGVWPWVRPEQGVWVATVWHVACEQRACEGVGMRDNIGSRQNNPGRSSRRDTKST